MSYITCKDLAVGYDGRSVASGLNFSIDKGDYLCIVGYSWRERSGKEYLGKNFTWAAETGFRRDKVWR